MQNICFLNIKTKLTGCKFNSAEILVLNKSFVKQ